MRKLNYDKLEIEQAIDLVVRKTVDMDLTWGWPCGVGFYGVSEAYEVTKNEEYLHLLKASVDELIELGVPEKFDVNACAMGHCLITLYNATKEDKYMDLIERKILYIREEALRFGDSVLQHTVSKNNDFPEQAWADTLFMAAFFLLRVGVMKEDEALIEDALNQWYWHIMYLQNMDNGLYYHGYDNVQKNHMSGIHWARANAWAAYTMSRVGNILPKAYIYPKFMDIAGSLNEQLSSLKLLQTEDGLWRTVLTDELSYEEISASAGIAAAMIERGNPLHVKYINKAIPGLLKNIGKDGKIKNVSGGTAVMNDIEGYRNISRTWAQGWGQGFMLAFLASIIKSENTTKDGAL